MTPADESVRGVRNIAHLTIGFSMFPPLVLALLAHACLPVLAMLGTVFGVLVFAPILLAALVTYVVWRRLPVAARDAARIAPIAAVLALGSVPLTILLALPYAALVCPGGSPFA